jgi:formylglycine-generating enzyme required for sulfatase activity
VKSSGPGPLSPKWSAILCEIVRVQFASISVSSTPSPAEVFLGEQKIGMTPMTNRRIKEGEFELDVRYPGYKTEIIKGVVRAGESKPFVVKLKNINAVIFGKPWTNTLKMKLVSLGNAMIGVTEVTRGQFREFVLARKLPALPQRELDDPAKFDLPVTFVSRADARSFCEWLTEKEQSGEIIEGDYRYRLPSDDEWSMAANLPREAGDSPAEKHLRLQTFYPWGFTWPPVPKPGNLFDESAAKKEGKGAKAIEGYNDGYEGVAPVGKFRPDWRGVMDLAGNVWEWVEDDYGGSDEKTKAFGTSRGGAWTTKERQELLASYRHAMPADTRTLDVGFRVLLSTNRPARDDD